MSARSPEERIRQLASELEPVSPIPPLWVVWTAALALGVVSWAVHAWTAGAVPRLAAALSSNPGSLATLVGLGAFAVGGLGAALASAVPGRDAGARLGARIALSGLGVAVAAGVFAFVRGDAAAHGVTLGECVACITHSATLGAASALAVVAFIAYAGVRRPLRGTVLAIAGGVALGAAAVHLGCANPSSLHWLLGHTLAPLAAIALLAAPVAMLLALLARREG